MIEKLFKSDFKTKFIKNLTELNEERESKSNDKLVLDIDLKWRFIN